MHAFYYDLIKTIFNDFKFLFTDTDSSCCQRCHERCHENPYEKFYEQKEYFKLSNYSKKVNIFVMIIKKYSVK